MRRANVPSDAIRYRLLGSFAVVVDDEPIVCGGVKQSSVLAMLLLEPNRPMTTAQLIAGLWGDQPPDRALATIQVYVSGLRRLLPTVEGEPPIETRPNGYLLRVDPASIDVARFATGLKAADAADRFRDRRLALQHLQAALDEWGGQPLADFEDLPFAASPTVALTLQRESIVERQMELRVELGEHRAVLPELEAAVVDMPLRESLWRLLMLAFYRSGRQADALGAFRRCREVLLEEFGIDPSPETRALELAMLRHDDELEYRGDFEQSSRGQATVPAKPLPMFALRLGTDDCHQLDADILIGRNDDCHIVVDEPQVSRRHAEIRRGPSGWILSDLSMNGTMVNGDLCSHHTIADGDVIVIGSQPITVEAIERAP